MNPNVRAVTLFSYMAALSKQVVLQIPDEPLLLVRADFLYESARNAIKNYPDIILRQHKLDNRVSKIFAELEKVAQVLGEVPIETILNLFLLGIEALQDKVKNLRKTVILKGVHKDIYRLIDYFDEELDHFLVYEQATHLYHSWVQIIKKY